MRRAGRSPTLQEPHGPTRGHSIWNGRTTVSWAEGRCPPKIRIVQGDSKRGATPCLPSFPGGPPSASPRSISASRLGIHCVPPIAPRTRGDGIDEVHADRDGVRPDIPRDGREGGRKADRVLHVPV